MRVSVAKPNSAATFHGWLLVPGAGSAPGGSFGTSPRVALTFTTFDFLSPATR